MSPFARLRKNLVAGGLALLAGTAAATAATPAGLSSRLDVLRAAIGANEDVTVRYTLHNGSTHDLLIVYWQTPLRGVFNDLFDVSRDGRPVAYTGRLEKWATPQAKDFLRIPAGGDLSAVVELSAVYDLSRSGEYTVRYRLHDVESPMVLGNAGGAELLRAQDLGSNAVTLAVTRDEAAEAARALPPDFYESEAQGIDPTYVTPGYVSCSTSRQTTLKSALGAAETMASKAKAYLATGAHDSGYTTWLGTYTTSNYATATAHFNSIYSVFNSKKVTFYCDCTDSSYAYVYPNQPYNIHLCGAFWSAPLTGTDSKGGTLVHECSHFTVVAGTDDWAYGQAGCKALSTAKKLDNADCHEYFAESK